MTRTKLHLHFRNLGKSLGYPECCTQYFIENPFFKRSKLFKLRHKFSPFHETGFVPCPSCQEHPRKVLTYIHKNRDSKLPPFPYLPNTKGTPELPTKRK